MSLSLAPITQKDAKAFVARLHRHNEAPLTSVFQVSVRVGEETVGVAMVGLPKARMSCDGRTLEVNRTCTDGARNANSMLYGACARAAKALGWGRLITYTLPSESGASLKASGWTHEKDVDSKGTWEAKRGKGAYQTDLFGERRMPLGPKRKWTREL